MSERLPVDNQARRRAITTLDDHMFVDAGAGTGKTTVLVDRYISILERMDAPSLQGIVTVTFTRKAAAEMKDRVRRECRKRAGEGEDKWREIAAELETAPIHTIHGLCARILRANALAAGIDPEFGVLDSTEAGLLLEETVRRSFLDRLAEGRDAPAKLVLQMGVGSACDAVAEIVKDRARLLHLLTGSDGSPLPPDDLEQRWRQAVEQRKMKGVEEICSGGPWRNAIRDLEGLQATDPEDTMEQKRMQALQLARTAADDSLPLQERFGALEELVGLSARGGSKSKWATEEDLDAAKEALKSFTNSSRSLASDIHELLEIEKGDDAGTAELTNALAQEVVAADDAYEQAKRRRTARDYADLLIGVRQLWRDRPEVLAQYQTRVRHLLIDELQDTNQVQREILDPICGRGAKKFVVGDAKQSIYRFRQADVTVFNDMRARMEQAADSALERLEVNFRSTPALTGFFNHLFSQEEVMGRAAAESFEAHYEPLRSYREAEGRQAAELTIVMEADDSESDKDDDADEASIADIRQAEAARLATRIFEIVAEQRRVFDDETGSWRPAQYGDFAMLFRSTTDISVYERGLRLEGIPYYTVEGRGFFSRQEVKDIVNCLRAIENVRDEVALVGVLRSPLFALSDSALFWMAQLEGSWWERLQALGGQPADGPLANISEADREKGRLAAQTLLDLRNSKNRLTLSELITAIIERTGLSATLITRFDGDQRVSNLRKLGDIAADFQRSGNYSLRGLIGRLKQLMVEEVRESQAPVHEEESDVVKLMTIHAAKGLEWPIVVLPDLGRKLTHGSRGFTAIHHDIGVAVAQRGEDGDGKSWGPIGNAIKQLNDDEEIAEERRVFYVACTRARDYLMMSASVKGGRQPKVSCLRWLKAAFDLELDHEGETEFSGDGWIWQVRAIPWQDVPKQHPQSRKSATVKAKVSPESIARGALADSADEQIVQDLGRRTAPLQQRFEDKDRFSVTEISTYVACPHRYRLQQIDEIPPAMPEPPRRDRARLKPAELGTVVHKLLRGVGTGGRERLRGLLAAGLGLPARLRAQTTSQVPEIEQLVGGYLDSDLYQRLVRTAEHLRTEMTVAFELPPAVIEGKIDALVEGADGEVHILDYKTGRRSPQTEAEYELQIGLYCEAVARASVGAIASAAIVYIARDGTEVVQLDPTEAAEEAMTVTKRAVHAIRGGDFPPDIGDHCTACQFAHVCVHRQS